MLARNVRDDWRDDDSPSLRRRRRIATLAALGVADFAIISLYQLGVIRHLPDPPFRLFDSDGVNGSHRAYRFGVPDGTSGALLHAGQLVLAGVGGTRRSGRHPIFDIMLGGAIAIGAAAAAQYLYVMVTKEKRACAYCLAGAAIAFGMVPLAAPEALDGVRALRRGRAT